MTTSFNMTRTQIAQRVLGKVIKIGSQSAASADYDLVYQALDLRLKEIHAKGMFWRKVTSVPVTFSLSSSIVSASAGAGDILFPIKMTVTDGSNDLEVQIIDSVAYSKIEDKTTTGTPEKALWKGGSEFIFYPVPNSNGTGKLLYEKIADDTSAGAAIDLDVAMLRPMIDLVKYDVADDYGVPEGTQQRWLAEMQLAERRIAALSAQRVALRPVEIEEYPMHKTNTADYGWVR